MKRTLLKSIAASVCLLALSGCLVDVETDESLGLAEQSILNGRPATDGEQWGTIGFLVEYEDSAWLCTGTLIAPDLILTAAHCLHDQLTGERATMIEVYAGAYSIDAPQPEQVYEVERVVAHPEALMAAATSDPTGLGARNDLALVRTTEPIVQVSTVPILPADRMPDVLFEGSELIIAGYGRRTVDQNGVSSEDGLHHVGTLTFSRSSGQEFLAGGSYQSDTCPGDSGGPVYVRREGKVWLVGTTSRGRDDYPTLDCGQGGIYTLVPAYADWIAQTAADPLLSERAWTPLGEDPEQTRQPLCSLRGAGRPSSTLMMSFALVLAALFWRRARLLALARGSQGALPHARPATASSRA